MTSKFSLSLLQDFMDRRRGAPSRSESSRSVKWIDGLRGLASFSVITTHLARAFDYDLFIPSDTPEAFPRFLQWPYLRLWCQGRIGVAIFALMTGFVCGIKPIKQIRAGDPHSALTTLAKSAFKRPMRLMLPGIIATLIAFILCNMGLFMVAGRVDAEWIRKSSPQPDRTWWDEFWRLERNLMGVWTNGHNDYDDHQWTLLPLLKSSLYVYATLTACVFLKYRWRMAVYTLWFAYFWQDGRPDNETFFCQALYGLFLSDLSQQPSFQAIVNSKHISRRVISVFLMIFGMFVASYPMEHADWSIWSRAIDQLQFLFPGDSYAPKRFTAIGLELAVLGLILNHTARNILCTWPFQFLGKYSFAVYLTHGTILKTILMWMIYGTSGQPWDENRKNDKGEPIDPIPLPRCGLAGFLFWVPIWIVIVYTVAWAWTTYVDSWCEKVSNWVLKKAIEEDEKSSAGANMA